MVKFKVKAKDCQLIVKAKLSLGEKLDEKELNNFSRKYIRGMLKTKKIKKNIVEYLGPISISLYDWCKKPISKYEFFFVMEQIVDLSQRMIVEELNINHVILDMKNIYINKQTKELQFIYLPLLRSEGINNIVELMYNIIYSVTPMQEREDEYISRFAYYLQGLQHFESNKIEDYIEKEESKVVNIIKKHHVGRSGFMTDKPKDYYEHYDRKSREDEPTGLLQENEETGLLEEELTGLLQENDATTLLREEFYQIHYTSLYRVLTKETISIHKPVFRLGKEKSYSDYVIDNNAVSRSHANIITRGKRHFIMDLNSTNKTYINDVQIMARQERELLDGDKIRLGNEEFVFHF